MNTMHFGSRVSAFRKDRELSQGELAKEIGVSQSTISRLESGQQPPEDARMLSRLARALELPLSELLEGTEVPAHLSTELTSRFWAFCPNPFCNRNRIRGNPDEPAVQWASEQPYDATEFESTNYCSKCGTELAKQCPSCKKPLTERGTRYCVTCGERITERPTTDEWSEMSRSLQRGVDEGKDQTEDDLPF